MPWCVRVSKNPSVSSHGLQKNVDRMKGVQRVAVVEKSHTTVHIIRSTIKLLVILETYGGHTPFYLIQSAPSCRLDYYRQHGVWPQLGETFMNHL